MENIQDNSQNQDSSSKKSTIYVLIGCVVLIVAMVLLKMILGV